MDSTILNKLGKRLEPDEKIRNSSEALNGLMESAEFKKRFKKESLKKLEKISENTYYKKYPKPNLSLVRKPLEESLKPKKKTAEDSSLITEKIGKLEFQFKRLNILKRK